MGCLQGARTHVVLLLLLLPAASADGTCIGEYQHCPSTGECTLFQCDGPGPHCASGQYRCPLTNTCVDGAAGLLRCPNITATWLDHTLSVDDRLTKLVAAANQTEMITQLTNKAPAIERLGIPGYNWLSDDEHAVRGWRSTYFPDGPGLGASFDKDLLFAVGTVVGQEARAKHNFLVHTLGLRENAFNGAGITVYGPNMNLVKDPRWGRAQEVYSEDPCLSSALTIGYVTGIQGLRANGSRVDPNYLRAGACCKHFVAYDLEGNGGLPSRVYFDADVDTRSAWEHYFPTFAACVVEAQASHVMCSYNSMNGVPTCADPNLLNGVLRGDFKWPGFVVSDYDAWANIEGTHHYTKDMEHTAAVGLNAGLDQEGGGTSAIAQLASAVAAGLTTSAKIETAFKRLMRVRMQLGMLDPPSLLMDFNALDEKDLQTPKSTALNRLAAAKGMVLLKNGGTTSAKNGGTTGAMRKILPLDASLFRGHPGSILVSGPVADDANNTLGNYACDMGNCSTNVTSVLAGLRNASTGLGGDEIIFLPGCASTTCPDDSGFPAAVAAAKVAHLSVVVLGTLGWDKQDPGKNADPNAYEREGHDRTSIALPHNQYQLAEQLANTGTPLLCVLIHGGSIQLGSLLDSCTAIVDAWFPGQQGGAGLADVVFGKVNPAGRSPQTFYSGDAELPKLGNMDVYAGNGTTYRYYINKPVVPFGFGLSYTTFTYSSLVVETGPTAGPCDTITVSVEVTNAGPVDGEEVVQLYVKTPAASVPAPRVRLADFVRVHIARGATRKVELVVVPKFHYVVKNDGKDGFWKPTIVVEAGPVALFVGGGQPDFTKGVLAANVTVTKEGALTTKLACAQ